MSIFLFATGVALSTTGSSREIDSIASTASYSIAMPILDPQHEADRQRLIELSKTQGYISFNEGYEPVVGFLSNHSKTQNGVAIWGKKFRCSEAAFHAAKFLPNDELVDQYCSLDGYDCIDLKFKMEAQGLRRADWFEINEQVMKEVLHAKFTQNENLRSLLLATGDAYLVEHTDIDGFWGDKRDQNGNPGRNRLGFILMTLRSELGGEGVVPAPAQYFEMLQNEKQN